MTCVVSLSHVNTVKPNPVLKQLQYLKLVDENLCFLEYSLYILMLLDSNLVHKANPVIYQSVIPQGVEDLVNLGQNFIFSVNMTQ